MTAAWPATSPLSNDCLRPLLDAEPTISTLSLPAAWTEQWTDVWAPVAARLAMLKQQMEGSKQAPVIGIHGGQGSGKSTLSRALAGVYRAVFGWNTVVLSIDDLYLPHADRVALAEQQHPLLLTRGVPGTHDAALGIDLIHRMQNLSEGDTLSIPAFDKASDDRLPSSQWHQVSGPVDLILFEGWCVGCQPVSDEELEVPLNPLEALEDMDGSWRHWVNAQLAGPYASWFAEIDFLLMLKVPDMQAVLSWRTQQETENRQQAQAGAPDRSLDAARLQRFIQHYQRLTEQALKYMPQQADLVLTLNPQHQVAAISDGQGGLQ